MKAYLTILGVFTAVCLCLLPGCVKTAPNQTATDSVNAKHPDSSLTPTTDVSAAVLETQVPLGICSPLADIKLSELENFISNPFSPALIADARDGGHHGVDFAYYTNPDTGKVMLGSPIYAMLAGRVASISSGKTPYGNLIIIETALEKLPTTVKTIFANFPQPTPASPETHLTCPSTTAIDQEWRIDQPSIYVLYAHMDQPAEAGIDAQVSCGEQIGLVGNSGKSGNPHLHLEIRYGPGNATFTSMAHYSGAATPEEMAAYCTWRVSGVFQAVDPMKLIETYALK
ncbi:MAG: M23 family metallopeptidase [Anaerolineaceae bacterium]